MATAHHPSHRASLLNGLRTGGVRATSMSAPHTAAPGGSFSIPRFASAAFDDEDLDDVSDLFYHNLHIQNSDPLARTGSYTRQMTGAGDASNNRFIQQQIASQKGLNPNSVPFSPAYSQSIQQPQAPSPEVQAYQQMQLMQLEIMRLQVCLVFSLQLQYADPLFHARMHSCNATNRYRLRS